MGIGTRAIVSYCLILAGSEFAILSMASNHADSPANPVYVLIYNLRSILFFGAIAVIAGLVVLGLTAMVMERRKEQAETLKKEREARQRAIDSKINEVAWDLKTESSKLREEVSRLENDQDRLRARVKELEEIVLVKTDEAAKAALSDFV